MQMIVGKLCYAAASRCAGQEADLHQVRLIDILQSNRFFPDGCRKRFQSDRTAVLELYNRAQHSPIRCIQAQLIHFQLA